MPLRALIRLRSDDLIGRAAHGRVLQSMEGCIEPFTSICVIHCASVDVWWTLLAQLFAHVIGSRAGPAHEALRRIRSGVACNVLYATVLPEVHQRMICIID